MFLNKILSLSFFLTIIFLPLPSFACDPCALSNVVSHSVKEDGEFVLGIQEQYTDFTRGNNDDYYSLKNGEIIRGFSTTQLSALYGITKNLALSVNMPFIIRDFDKVTNFRRNRTSDAGIGDASILMSYNNLLIDKSDFKFSYGMFVGIKLPTGDSGSISDNTQDNLKHHPITGITGSAGRLFAFGTGSVDVPFGFDGQLLAGRVFVPAYFQYTYRTEGSYDYRFDNDIAAFIAPGYLLLLEDEYSLSSHVVVYSEFKGADTLKGERQALSSYSNVYVGPSIMLTLDSGFSGDFSFLFRTTSEDRAIVAPDTRIRFGISKKF